MCSRDRSVASVALAHLDEAAPSHVDEDLVGCHAGADKDLSAQGLNQRMSRGAGRVHFKVRAVARKDIEVSVVVHVG